MFWAGFEFFLGLFAAYLAIRSCKGLGRWIKQHDPGYTYTIVFSVLAVMWLATIVYHLFA